MKKILLFFLLIANLGFAQALYFPGASLRGPGFAPMQRGSVQTVTPPNPSLPSANYVGVWYAENFTNAGVGGVATITDSSIRADGVVRRNDFSCSVETEKPTLGSDSYGYYVVTDGGDRMVAAPGSGSSLLGYSGSMTLMAVIMPAVSTNTGIMAAWNHMGPNNAHRDAYFSSRPGGGHGWTDDGKYELLGAAVAASYSTSVPTLISYEWEVASLTIRFNGVHVVRDTSDRIKAFTATGVYGSQRILAEHGGYWSTSGSRVYAYVIFEGVDHAKTLAAEAFLANKYGLVLP